MSRGAIELVGVSVIRGRRKILSLEQLTVASGELLVVLGPNGAGKSTLLKCCVGMVRPTTGRVGVLGQSVPDLSGAGLTQLRRRVAYLAQVLTSGSEMPLTLREVVAIGCTGRAGLLRPLRSSDWQTVDHWIDRLGLRALAHSPYGLLSGGEQRKTLLALAMVQQPEILLLDEATTHLDVYWREQIVAALEGLHAGGGLTVVMVCHDLEAIPRCADRVLILRNGHLLAYGPPAEVLVPDQMEALYGRGLTVLRRGDRYFVAPEAAEGHG